MSSQNYSSKTTMPEHILFLTGKLAEKNLHKVLASMQPLPFTFTVHQIGVSVAALMTAEMVERRLTDAMGATKIIVPGRCRGDLTILEKKFNIPVERGPDELKDLPQHFGRKAIAPDLSKYDVLIFAEIVEAPQITIEQILARARAYKNDGADVIDLGCLPSTAFPHLADAVRALKAEGFKVSVDSMETDDLICGGKAGADYLLSLNEHTVWVADEVASTPVLIPTQPGDMASLERAMGKMQSKGRAFFADAILDPIHFGLTDSIVRYSALRKKFPDVQIMMGIGNLTELTDADTTGINAILMGIISELHINAVLATQVSGHATRAVREADIARRIMFATRESNSLPKGVSDELLSLHERKPFPDTPAEIAELASLVKDPSFRIQIGADGIHVYNRDGHYIAKDAFDLFEHLKVEADGSHAFYLGVEIARAQIAFELGKRYVQDEALNWGAAVEKKAQDMDEYKAAGSTLSHKLRGIT
jgi:dihydropteroate synthase